MMFHMNVVVLSCASSLCLNSLYLDHYKVRLIGPSKGEIKT